MKLYLINGCLAFVLIGCGGAETNENSTNTASDTLSQTPAIAEEPVPENSFLLDIGTVGVFKVGAPFPRLPEELKSRKAYVNMKNEDGVEEEHIQYIVFNSLEDVAEVVLEKNEALAEDQLAIQEIRVISNYFETDQAIAVGKTVSELTEKYPDAKFVYLGSSAEIVAETSALPGVKFVIDPDACTKKVNGNVDIPLTSKNFKEDAKVRAVLVQ